MTKIEGIQSMVESIFGKDATVESTDCGQRYWVKGMGTIYVDTLKGGRVSIKIKYFAESEAAYRAVKAMWNWLYYFSGITVDAASKADIYSTFHPRYGRVLYAARLRCDKWW